MDNQEYVYVNVVGERVRILDQSDEVIMDFLSDDRIANKLACKINIGTLVIGGREGPIAHGLLQD